MWARVAPFALKSGDPALEGAEQFCRRAGEGARGLPGEGELRFESRFEGHKIDAIRACGKACFTVWQDNYRKEGDWSWYVTGVIAFGRAEIVEDRAVVIDKVRKLALKYYPTAEEVEKEIARDGNRVGLIALTVEHMTGKLVHEK